MTRRRLPRRGWSSATVLTALLIARPLVAQGAARDTTVRVTGDAVVDVSVRTGRLLVRGIDGATGTVRTSRTDYRLRSTGTSLTVTTRDDDRRDRDRDGTTLELDLPRGVSLNVSTLSADVEIVDMRGRVDVRTTVGDVRLAGVRGRAFVETVAGNIASSGSGTLLRVTTVSGDLRLREAAGELDLNSTSGDISISGNGLTRVAVESMSGDVGIEGGLTDDARVRITTHSGDVTLRLPDDARGELEVATFNGTVTAGTPLTLLPGELGSTRRGRSTRRYQIGGGGPLQLDITTFNGDLRLLRGPR